MKVFQHPRSRLDVVSWLRSLASRYPNDGRIDQTVLLQKLNALYVPERGPAVRVLFSRDSGAHTSGWWKNPDYDRCYHLSLSFYDLEVVRGWLAGEMHAATGSLAKDRKETEAWIELFYGDYARLIWCEPPASKAGKLLDVWHYRLFCDPHWQPLLPRGEVYTREFTEAGWKSWSDVQAAEQAAALQEAAQ